MRDEIRWFEDSPDAGWPECICSYCGERIEEPEPEEEEEPDISRDYGGPPIRMWKGEQPVLEARFHPRCFAECLERGVVALK